MTTPSATLVAPPARPPHPGGGPSDDESPADGSPGGGQPAAGSAGTASADIGSPDGGAAGAGFPGEVAALLRGTPRDAAALRHALDAVVADPSGCLDWLATLLADGPALAAVTRRSYWHPNHFAKLVLHVPDDGGFRIRLHVWPEDLEGPRLGESNPHSHRWEFASTVLAGAGLDMVEYAETTGEGTPYVRYRYGGDPADPAALRGDGPARLVAVRTPTARPGASYSCDTSVIHTVAPVGRRLVATLVFQGPHRGDSTVVYREEHLGAEQPNRPIVETEVRRLIRWVLDARRGGTAGP